MPNQEISNYYLYKRRLHDKIEEKAKEILDEFFFGDISKLRELKQQGGQQDYN